jgi:carotenoid cleavage dioxygenase-like enzyme
MEHPFLGKNWNSKITRFEFNMTTGGCKKEEFLTERSTEFPIANQDMLCYKTKYMYFALDFETVGDSEGARNNVIHSGFIKVDTDTK